MPEADAPLTAAEAEQIAREYLKEQAQRETSYPLLSNLVQSGYVRTTVGGSVTTINGTSVVEAPLEATGWLLVYEGDMSTPVPMSPGMVFEIAFLVFDDPNYDVDYCAGTTFGS